LLCHNAVKVWELLVDVLHPTHGEKVEKLVELLSLLGEDKDKDKDKEKDNNSRGLNLRITALSRHLLSSGVNEFFIPKPKSAKNLSSVVAALQTTLFTRVADHRPAEGLVALYKALFEKILLSGIVNSSR